MVAESNFWKTEIKLNGYTQSNKKLMVIMDRDGVTKKKMKIHWKTQTMKTLT